MSNGRHAKIYEKIFDSQVWGQKDPVRIIFLYLFVIANHDNGSVQGLPVKRGQTYRSQRTIADDCHYSRSTVRSALATLEKLGKISVKRPDPTQASSLITITNYNEYQGAVCPPSIPPDRPRSSPKQESNNKKQISSDANNLAKFLLTSISKAENRKLISKPNGSAKDIQKLLDVGIPPKDIKATIEWLTGPNMHRDFRFVVQSGRALLDKWDRIQTSMRLSADETKSKQEIRL